MTSDPGLDLKQTKLGLTLKDPEVMRSYAKLEAVDGSMPNKNGKIGGHNVDYTCTYRLSMKKMPNKNQPYVYVNLK